MGKREKKGDHDLRYLVAFGKHLKETREKIEWSQSELSAYSSVSEGQISAIENGHQSPRLYTLKALALALGKTPSEILDFKFDLKVNTSFHQKHRQKKAGTTNIIKNLFDDNFFKSAKTVKNVREECRNRFGVDLKSAEISGVLLLLANKNNLRKIRSGNVNMYQNKY